MKYMSNGSLQDICYKESNSYHSNLSNEMKLKFSYQAAKGILNLHSKHIIHRDLACRNLLVDDKFDIYVADFGFARLKHVASSKEFTSTKLGPVRWEAPESLERKEYSEKTDSFSFGVCLYEIITGKQPWDFCTTPALVAVNVLRGDRLQIPINCDPVLADLAWNCWKHDPRARPTFTTMVSILSDRHKQVVEDTRAMEKEFSCIEFMIAGVDVLKYPFIKPDDKFKFKKPQSRFLRLKSNLKSLFWRSSAVSSHVFSSASRNKVVVERGIDISEILEVKVGFATENFRLQITAASSSSSTSSSVSSSFSILTANRSVDLTCESSSHRDQWVWGIRFLLNRHREAQLTGNQLIQELKLFYLPTNTTGFETSPSKSSSLLGAPPPLPPPPLPPPPTLSAVPSSTLQSLHRLTFTSLPHNPTIAFQSHDYLTILRSLIYRLRKGGIILKFKNKRKVHAKRIFLSADLTEIVWNMKDEEEVGNKRAKTKSIMLSEIDSISYEPPNFSYGNSRVAAVAANLSESLLRRHHTTVGMNASASPSSGAPNMPSSQSDRKKDRGSDRGSVEGNENEALSKKGRPRKNSQESASSVAPQAAGAPSSSTWVQALIPSLKREKSDDPYGGGAPSPLPPHGHDHLGSLPSDTDTDVRPDDLEHETGLQGEDIDAQYCITYLRHDGKTLLAIQCPNRDVFELWSDGLTAVIIGLRHSSRRQTAATYNSGAEFTISGDQQSKELFGQV
jgi:serine/threonine protein kinase